MASSISLSYEYSVVLQNGAHLLLPSIHPRYLSLAERRCDSCSTIWGERPNDEDYIEYPFFMIPCQHIVGSACLGLSLKEEKPACPVCNTRIRVGKQVEAPLHHTNTSDESSLAADNETRSGAESNKDGRSLADNESSDLDLAHDDTAGIPSAAADGDTSNVRTVPVQSSSHDPADDVFSISFTPVNRSTRVHAGNESNSRTTTGTSVETAPMPSIQMTPQSRSQTEETEIAVSSSEPSEPSAPTRTLTRLDPEWYDKVVPPKAKPANHPHSKPRPISDYVWTMATVQGAIDACNVQRNMALEMPYLQTMVAMDNYRRGIHGRKPTPWELVTALQDLYGYGR